MHIYYAHMYVCVCHTGFGVCVSVLYVTDITDLCVSHQLVSLMEVSVLEVVVVVVVVVVLLL